MQVLQISYQYFQNGGKRIVWKRKQCAGNKPYWNKQLVIFLSNKRHRFCIKCYIKRNAPRVHSNIQAKHTNNFSSRYSFWQEDSFCGVDVTGWCSFSIETDKWLLQLAMVGRCSRICFGKLSIRPWSIRQPSKAMSSSVDKTPKVATCCSSTNGIAKNRMCHNKRSTTCLWLRVVGSKWLRWHSKMDQRIRAISTSLSFFKCSPSLTITDSTVSASSSSKSYRISNTACKKQTRPILTLDCITDRPTNTCK